MDVSHLQFTTTGGKMQSVRELIVMREEMVEDMTVIKTVTTEAWMEMQAELIALDDVIAEMDEIEVM